MPNKTIKEALLSPQTSATTITAIIKKLYGEDALSWEPLTIALELKSDFGVDVPSEIIDKWSAMQIALTTDYFFTRFDAFSSICNTLATGEPYFEIFDPVTTEEAAWAIAEVALNRKLEPFSYTIRNFLSIILDEDGFTPETYPEVFKQVFNIDVKSKDVISAVTAGVLNNENIELFINSKINDIKDEFASLSDFNLNDYIHVNLK